MKKQREKYVYESWDPFVGCIPNGFDKECDHCCGLTSAYKIAGGTGKVSRVFRRALGKKDGKRGWNGDIIFNPYCIEKLHARKQRNFIVSYHGEIALVPISGLVFVFQAIHDNPRHLFTILTKKPDLLWEKMQLVIRYMDSINIDLKKLLNLKIATSVGENQFNWRIDALRKFAGFEIEVWHKPLIGPVFDANYEFVNCVRINKEKGGMNQKRPCSEEWVENIIKIAKKQGILVYNDIKNGKEVICEKIVIHS